MKIVGERTNLPYGVVPASPENGDIWTTASGTFVRINNATVGPLSAGGGGGVPGGATTQIQYNNGGVFAGSAGLTWDEATNTLGIVGANGGLMLKGIDNEPSIPPVGHLDIYAKNVAGRMIAKIKGPSGLDTPLQSALWGNNIVLWTPTTATAGFWQGTLGAGLGTYTTALPIFNSTIYQSIKRGRWANVFRTSWRTNVSPSSSTFGAYRYTDCSYNQ
jgi:hypothetical protein